MLSYLIWKWAPEGSQKDNNRENSIRWGSSLRVKDGEVAVFVYKQDNNTFQDYIVGPFDKIIETTNFPVLTSLIGLAYDGKSPFQAEIYFINLAQIIQVKFAVPFFDVYDPRFSDFGVPVAVRGTINFRIEDYKNFIKLHRLNSFNIEDFQTQIRGAVNRYVKDVVANAPSAHNIPLVQIESKTSLINDSIEFDISERFRDEYGVVISSVDISAIELDKTSEAYTQLLSVTRDIEGATVKAEAEAKIKDIAEKQTIEAKHYEESLRIQREEGQYAQRKQTESSNFSAYQVEKQAEVGIAGAKALGQMGANGAGNVDLGSGGVGFNPAAMMAGMAVGGAVGQNIAGTMSNMMSDANLANMTPPPVPTIAYYVAVNGQATGPYDMNTLKQMASANQLTIDSLVWASGMPEWVKAETVENLKSLFTTMPPIPTT